MSNFLICQKCNGTISGKKLEYDKLKREGISGEVIYKRLNITRICCQVTITTSQVDDTYKEYMERTGRL